CDPSVAEQLWLRVLSFLGPRELCMAALVCSEMKRCGGLVPSHVSNNVGRLADDDDLWQHWAFRRMNYTTKPESRPWKEVFGMRSRCALLSLRALTKRQLCGGESHQGAPRELRHR